MHPLTCASAFPVIRRKSFYHIFSDASEFVADDFLPPIPNRIEARDDKNHSKFSNMFRGGVPFNGQVYRAAYWGSRRDYLKVKPKIDVNPIVVLQYLMLRWKSYRLLIL